MRRRVFNILTALSLLLFVATVVIWVRSYWRADQLGYGRVRTDTYPVYNGILVASTHGGLRIQPIRYSGKPLPPDAYAHLPIGWQWTTFTAEPYPLSPEATGDERSLWNRIGFEAKMVGFDVPEGLQLISYRVTVVTLPYYSVALLTGILPFVRACLWGRRYHRSKKRSRLGLCLTCGYDLRATPDKCPECGTPIDETRYPRRNRIA
jgi:hypothetical protein